MADTDQTYRIRVQGRLDDRWADWLGGLAMRRRGDGTTELVGAVPDQAALHGVIGCIRDLGLPLLSVNRVKQPKQVNRVETVDGIETIDRIETVKPVDCARTHDEQFARSGGE